jgi:hypothetical protein
MAEYSAVLNQCSSLQWFWFIDQNNQGPEGEICKVEASTHVSGYPTNQELAECLASVEWVETKNKSDRDS